MTFPRRSRTPLKLLQFLGLLATAALLSSSTTALPKHRKSPAETHSAPRLTQDLTGSVPAHDGERIRLSTELGNIVVHTQSAQKIDYHVHLEADASEKDAQQLLKSFTVTAREIPDGVLLKAEAPSRHWSGRLWATLELTIPKNANLEASTGGGNIDSSEIQGHLALNTEGGNINAGNVDGSARFETGGGNIVAKTVSGELFANTGGGHIIVESIGGNATLHTSGGHIRVGSIQGAAHLDTDGGNITLEHSGAELTAETGGGEIEVGEAAGLVRAKTGGGGIRVVRMFGPTNLESAGGSIYLTQVDSPVRAFTSTGGITAWFVAPLKSSGTCDLQASDGDIVVHLPRELPVTIDAQVERGSDHRVIVDPAFPLRVSYDDSSRGSRAVRAEGSLNGGGELLRLRTVAGNIRFVLSDTSKQLELYKQQMDQLQRQIESKIGLPTESQGTNDGSHP